MKSVQQDLTGECQVAHFFPTAPIWTPEIERAACLVARCISCDLPGSHIWGIQRVGKTEFARYLVLALSEMVPASTAFYWSFIGCKPKSREDILRICLYQTGVAAIASRQFSALLGRLVTAVAERAMSARARRIVLIADEMQNVPSELYNALMSVTSALQDEKFSPHVLSIGQPEMQQAIEVMHQNNYLQLLGRFFPVVGTYRGLTTADIRETLMNLDGPERQFTARWFPSRAEEGWGLGELSGPIEQAVAAMVNEQNLTAHPRIPFGFLRPALVDMFQRLAQDKSVELSGTDALQSFRTVGLLPLVRHYVDAGGAQ